MSCSIFQSLVRDWRSALLTACSIRPAWRSASTRSTFSMTSSMCDFFSGCFQNVAKPFGFVPLSLCHAATTSRSLGWKSTRSIFIDLRTSIGTMGCSPKEIAGAVGRVSALGVWVP